MINYAIGTAFVGNSLFYQRFNQFGDCRFHAFAGLGFGVAVSAVHMDGYGNLYARRRRLPPEQGRGGGTPTAPPPA
uniref:Uncharacterized protein n=1 Tax=Conchiformibius kuhniae TaxID=211502 RepID=A0A8T9MW25_9NEIS|nr:hypothetical protein LVJ77_03875 [Conchiformibius kuhniae]